jgi:hypothetical protein
MTSEKRGKKSQTLEAIFLVNRQKSQVWDSMFRSLTQKVTASACCSRLTCNRIKKGKLTHSFEDKSKIKGITMLYETPSGMIDIVTIEFSGQEFAAMDRARSHDFALNKAISFK